MGRCVRKRSTYEVFCMKMWCCRACDVNRMHSARMPWVLCTSQAMNRLAFVVIVGGEATAAGWNNPISATHKAPNVPAICYTSAQIKRISGGLGAILCMENCNNMNSVYPFWYFSLLPTICGGGQSKWNSRACERIIYYYLGFSLRAEPVHRLIAPNAY